MKLAFRVDATPGIGTGHIRRCAALADGLRLRGGNATFISRGLSTETRAYLLERGHDCVELPGLDQPADFTGVWPDSVQDGDLDQTVEAAGGNIWDWIVVDHYGLGHQWESRARALAAHSLVIDDLADRRHDCDLLLDQNLQPGPARYSGLVPARCETLLGPRFALLRAEFAVARARPFSRNDTVRKIVVAFGGVDAANDTALALTALTRAGVNDLRVDVIIGSGHPDREGIAARCHQAGFTCHVQPNDVAGMLRTADLGVGAGGISVWERCCVGLPTITFAVAHNQRAQVKAAAVEGMVYAPDVPPGGITAESIERHATAVMHNAALREAISRRGLDAVDGRGVERVLRRMGLTDLVVSPATAGDSRMVYDWRNHPAIREVSLDRTEISWEGHQQWYDSALHDRNRVLLLGRRGDLPIGVVRFDIEDGVADVSIYLSPVAHAPGTGGALLAAAERWLVHARGDVHRLHARVVRANSRSHGLFRSSGYVIETTSYEKRLQRAATDV